MPAHSSAPIRAQKHENTTGRCVGIDLGTTYSAVAYVDESGRVDTLRNEEGDLTTPSVVFFDGGGPIVGREAIRAAEFDPGRVARFVKRNVGESVYPKPISGQNLPPEVLQALILRKLKSDSELRLRRVDQAVITVPAYFNEPRRKSTQDAGRLAGLDVMDIVNEPTAAAIAYGIQSGFLSPGMESPEKERVMVYDLGGGTFDVTIMEIDGPRFDTLGTAGDVYLGGIDWDRRLMDLLAEKFQSVTGVDLRENSSAVERLVQEAETAKKTMSVRQQATVVLGPPGNEQRLTVDRSEFEAASSDLLERTRMTCQSLLRDTGMQWHELTRILLVGGATRMPMVQTMLENESGLVLDRSLSPDEAVAQGAAWYAAFLSGQPEAGKIRISNVNSHDLGVLGRDPATGRSRRQIMIPRNSVLPASVSKKFLTARPGQENVVVNVVEGGTDEGQYATRIGECRVAGLPGNLPKGTCVKVTFRYTGDGRLNVSAEIPDVECVARTTIVRGQGLEDAELQKWKEILDSGLKIEELGSELSAGMMGTEEGKVPPIAEEGIQAPAVNRQSGHGEQRADDPAGRKSNGVDGAQDQKVETELDALMNELDCAKQAADGRDTVGPSTGSHGSDSGSSEGKDTEENRAIADDPELQKFLEGLG